MLARLQTRTAAFFRQLAHDFSDDDCYSMAAALAYYAVFSLPSLLLIVIYIIGLVYGQAAAGGEIQARLGRQMGPQIAGEIQTMVGSAAHNRGAGLLATGLGIAGLLFSAISVVMQLQLCLNRAWKVVPGDGGIRGYVMKRINAFLLIVALGIIGVASLGAGSVLARVSRTLPFGVLAYVSENIVSIGIFATLFALILKVLPDAQLRWRDVWLGAIVIALLFEAGKFLIGLYLGHTATASTYGAAGSLALLLLWFYYSALVFLLGVEFTQVWVQQQGRRPQPKEGAVRLGEQLPARG